MDTNIIICIIMIIICVCIYIFGRKIFNKWCQKVNAWKENGKVNVWCENADTEMTVEIYE